MAYRATAKTEAHRLHTRQQILDAAQARVLAGGFSRVSMSAVAADAGVATGTLYRHFSNKAELCTELFRNASQREVDHVREDADGPETAGERLERTAQGFASRAIRGRHLAYALIAEPLDPILEQQRLAFRQAYADVFQTLLDEGVSEGDFRPMDTRTAATALVGALAECLVGPLAPTSEALDQQQRQNLINEICQFCLGAVSSKRSLT